MTNPAGTEASSRARRFGILDLGSTTFQLLVADGDETGSLTPVLRDRVVLNLGLVLADQGRIPSDVAARAAATARRLREVAMHGGADEIVAIATSALRDSPNRSELDRLLEDSLGMPVEFIDGREEARLTFAGVRASVALEPGAAVLLDLGGGSLEVALADGNGLRWGMSLPVGAGRLTGLLVSADPPSRSDRKAIRRAVEEAMAPIAERIEGDVGRCVASGGTAGALTRLLAARRWTTLPASLNQMVVPMEDLSAISSELGSLTLAQRLRLPGIDERRAELLPAGGWILTAAARVLGAQELIHSEWGLREGIVLDRLGLADLPAPTPADLRRRSVERLVAGWSVDVRHPALVGRLAGELLDGLAELHDLNARDRELLVHAALLHEIGNAISPGRYHKHGAYLVENGGLRGFGPDEIAVIASIVRFQRGKEPRDVYAPFRDLPAARRDATVLLTGILRLTHAIGRGDEPETIGTEVEVRPKTIRIGVVGSNHPDAVIEEALAAAPLLERSLGRVVELTARHPTSVAAS